MTSSAQYGAVVLGGGHHATIIAPYLARAGLSAGVDDGTAFVGWSASRVIDEHGTQEARPRGVKRTAEARSADAAARSPLTSVSTLTTWLANRHLSLPLRD